MCRGSRASLPPSRQRALPPLASPSPRCTFTWMPMTSSFSAGEVRRAGLLTGTPGWVWLLGPYLLVLAGTLLLPLANLAVISVFRHNPSSMWVAEPTAANYLRLLDAYYMQVLVRTLRIGFITTIFCLL